MLFTGEISILFDSNGYYFSVFGINETITDQTVYVIKHSVKYKKLL